MGNHTVIEHAVQPAALPLTPLTIEGASVLHQMLRIRWSAWRALAKGKQAEVIAEASPVLAAIEKAGSGLFSMLGHKGDLMLVHFRQSFEQLKQVELSLASLALWDYLEPTSSYLSVVELGLYDSTVKEWGRMAAQGIVPHSEEWNREVEGILARQKEAMASRLYPEIPDRKYICFYPMDRRRGEEKNWYQVPMNDRQRMMREHGMIGRRYADHVKQIITGSIGFDDWEWGVDLFADDALVFKRLIYDMRFDEVSAVYALFGSFYVGVRVRAAGLGDLLSGRLPNGA
jgi:hydrogen peroxide-dependent heme synthase